MHKGQKVSDIELDAIDIYNHFPEKSIEIIAKELRIPIWFAQRAVFKSLNGLIKAGYYVHKQINSGSYVQVRHSVHPTGSSVSLARQQTKQSNLQLRTVYED